MEHTEIGEVVRVLSRTVEIRLSPADNCGECGVKDSCHAGPGTSGDRFVTALDPFGLKTGQKVKINLDPKHLVQASILLFALPLLGLLLGALGGSYFAKAQGHSDSTDLYAIIGSFIGIGITILGLRSYNKTIESSKKFYPTVVKIM